MKKIYIISASLLTFSLLSGAIASANSSTGQQGSLDIVAGNELLFLHQPENFNFETTFVPTAPINLYKTLNPGTASEILKISDNTTEAGFTVTMAASDFTSPPSSNKIHFDKMSFVTLHQSLTEGEEADGQPTNIPPGAPNVIANQNCPWDPTSGNPMEATCDGLMVPFTESTESADSTVSNQIDILNNTTATDTGIYSIGFGFKLNIDPTTKPGTYSSMITFTLMPL